jgi:hypothetical protein
MVSLIHRIALFSLVLLSMMGETESLVSFVMGVRQKGFWGALGGQHNGFPQATSLPTIPTESVPSSIKEEIGGFDPDAYRKQMTDLVYQRNLDRFSS